MDRSPRAGLLLDALPVAAAIGVFGVIYGASAAPVLGHGATVASSVLLFSGAAQFTMVALAQAGASPEGVLLAVAALGLRHVPLAAVVLPRLPAGRGRRGLLALVLLDETVGLAVARPRPAARTMVVVGLGAYVAWVAGTAAGVLGADLLGAAEVAGVVFVILFVGLSALTCRSHADARRAAGAAVLTGAAAVAVPAAGAFVAVLVAVACAATVRRRRDDPDGTRTTAATDRPGTRTADRAGSGAEVRP
ncbi:AzlC family ABC transporter permease [Cellulomonas cellasea]|uniref:Putative branched-subunit amino acid permease n=1 Tax=Cellulomonas cellasea TaxID=43670 RepID=A0A7W4YC82_9CELL|nr:AzlC family ABC transporter permease [Cellulomonas cellasea]MBB2923276.1 putative branched-subunit amino acid permease [Cellulomonas cellasea]